MGGLEAPEDGIGRPHVRECPAVVIERDDPSHLGQCDIAVTSVLGAQLDLDRSVRSGCRSVAPA